MTANLSQIYNSGSLYEQLISQVIALESQPRLALRTAQTDQSVYKGVLSDFDRTVSKLDSLLTAFADPLRSPFAARAASVPEGAGFTASASDDAVPAEHAVRVDRLARADTRLSKQTAAAGTDLGALFGSIAAPEPRSFTVHVAQDDGDPVDIEVSYTPEAGASNDAVLAGLAAAVNEAVAAAREGGALADGTGVAASVVRETSGTARLSLRSGATGYGNRLTFTDPDGVLAALEVSATAVRSGTGGGAVYAVGSGPEDSALSAAFTLDGLALYRDTNTVDDALDGVTLTLSAVTAEEAALSVGPDTKGMRSQVDSFVKAYNEMVSFIANKSTVDADTGSRGVFAGDAGMRALRYGMRSDLAAAVPGALGSLTEIGVTTQRDGTLKVTDADALEAALASSPEAVDALFNGEDGLVARLSARIDGLLGTSGTIAQRKKTADDRIERLGAQIARFDARLERREAALRAQFEQLDALSTQANAQQQSLLALYY